MPNAKMRPLPISYIVAVGFSSPKNTSEDIIMLMAAVANNRSINLYYIRIAIEGEI